MGRTSRNKYLNAGSSLFTITLLLLIVVSTLHADTPMLDKPKWLGLEEVQEGVRLRWFRVQGAVGYIVHRKVGANGPYITLSRVVNPAFQDSSIEPGKTYIYRIVAIGRNGEASLPSVERFHDVRKISTDLVSAPFWEQYQVRADGLALTWSHGDSGNVIAYNILRKGPEDTDFQLISSTITTSYMDRAVSAGKTYEYVLTAVGSKLQESTRSTTLRVLFISRVSKSIGDERLKEIATLEEVVVKTHLVDLFNWDEYGFVSPMDVDYWLDEARLYISDTGTGIITVLGSQGEVIHQLGGMGNSPWEFERLLGIALDGQGFLYASDAFRGEIVVFTPRGTFLKRIRLMEEVEKYFGSDFRQRFPWFRFGLSDLLIGFDGLLYIVDNPNGWIYVMDSRDEIINVIGQKGNEPGLMHNPTFITPDYRGRIFVSDTINSRVQVFSSVGVPEGISGGQGMGIGQFIRPKGLLFDDEEHLFVADSYLNVIQVFSIDGDFLGLLGDERGFPIDLGSPNGMAFIPPDKIAIVERLGRKIQVRSVTLDSPFIRTQKALVAQKSVRTTTDNLMEKRKMAIRGVLTSYDKLAETLKLLGEKGGSITITEPFYLPGGGEVIEDAFPVLHEIARIVESDTVNVDITILAMDPLTRELSKQIARERVETLLGHIKNKKRLSFSEARSDTPIGDIKDSVELIIRKIK